MPPMSKENQSAIDPRRDGADTQMLRGSQISDLGACDFGTWSHANLARFAREAWAENQALRADLRVAIDAYRTAFKLKGTQ